MCLQIQQKEKCFLYFEGELIAYKMFEVIEEGGKVKLESACMHSQYEFEIVKDLDLLMARENNKKQEIETTVIVKGLGNYSLYYRICQEYYIEPSKEVSKFLQKLFESYS